MTFEIPPEVLEKIFSYLDGRSLGRASLVNRAWNREARRLTRKLDTWRRFLKEIPLNDLVELTTNLELHLSLSKLDNVPITNLSRNLCSVYTSWWLWRQISRLSPSVVEFASAKEVTCAKLSGSCIVTGHASGQIQVWNAKGILIASGHVHRRKLDDLLLVSTNAEESLTISERLGLAHHCVLSTSEDEQLALTSFCGTLRADGVMKLNRPEILLPLQRSVVAVRAIPATEYILIVGKNGDELTGYLCECYWSDNGVSRGNSGTLEINYKKVFLFPGKVDVKTINCYPPKMVAALTTSQDTHAFIQFDLEKEETEWLTFRPLRPAGDFMQDPNIFRANICIWIENYTTTRLHVLVNDSPICKREVRPALPAVPICYNLHASILFMGTSVGTVLAFDARNLPNLDLDKPVWKTHLKCGAIRAISVSESIFGPRLVAVSENRVHYVEFKSDAMLFFPFEERYNLEMQVEAQLRQAT